MHENILFYLKESSDTNEGKLPPLEIEHIISKAQEEHAGDAEQCSEQAAKQGMGE